MKRLKCPALLAALVVALCVALVPLHAYAAGEDASEQTLSSWEDLAGKKVAMLTGSPFEETIREKCPDVGEILYFASTPDLIAALQAGKVDAIVNNNAVCSLADRRFDDITLFPESLKGYDMGIAFPKGSALTSQFAAITERMRNDGTADELWEKWTSPDDSIKTVPEQDWPGSNGTLKVIAGQSLEPVTYYSDGQMLGYDIETLLIAAKELDVHLEFTPAELSEVLAFLQSGKADIGCGSLLITEERAEAMDFATTHSNDLVLLVRDYGTGTSEEGDASTTAALELSTVDEVIRGRIGMVVGTSVDGLLMGAYEEVDSRNFSYYNSNAELVSALKANKIDAFATDLPVAALAVSRNEGIALLPDLLVIDHYGFALPKGSPLTAQFDEIITRMREDGTIEEIFQKWTGSDEDAKVMSSQDWDAPNGTLQVAFNAEVEPACYLKEGKPTGFSVEILMNVARELGYHLKMKEMNVPAIIAALQSGKADIGASNLSITEERKKTVDMTVPYYDGGVAAVVRVADNASQASAADSGFLAGIAASFERTFITENRWQLILSGLIVTMLVTLCSGALGTLLGFVTVLLRRSGNHAVGVVVDAFEGLMGRLPIVVVLMVFYYVVFGSIDIPGVVVAIIVFTLAFGASSGAIMWNAMKAVDVGQSEASLALGFNDNETFLGIVLPQAARNFMPLLSSQLVSLAKDTSVVGYIAVMDLTRAGDLIRSRTMEAFFPLIATAVIYFALCCLLAAAMGLIIKRLDLDRRPRTIKGVEL